MARIRYINNEGNGFADEIETREGETVGQFLARQGVRNAANYHIRLNGNEATVPSDVLPDGARLSVVSRPGTVSADQTLQAGDRVSVTPKKIAGAVLAIVSAIFNDTK